jgi:hypothetical protein
VLDVEAEQRMSDQGDPPPPDRGETLRPERRAWWRNPHMISAASGHIAAVATLLIGIVGVGLTISNLRLSDQERRDTQQQSLESLISGMEADKAQLATTTSAGTASAVNSEMFITAYQALALINELGARNVPGIDNVALARVFAQGNQPAGDALLEYRRAVTSKGINPIDRSSALTGQATIYYTLAGNPSLGARGRQRYLATATSDDDAALAIFYRPSQTSLMTQANVDYYRAKIRLEDIAWSGTNHCGQSKSELRQVNLIEQQDPGIASALATSQRQAEDALSGCG